MYDFHTEENFRPRRRSPKSLKRTVYAIFVLGFLAVIFSFLLPPEDFPAGTVVEIEEGSSLEDIANQFEANHLVKSAGLFKTFVIASGGDKNISAGSYLFKNKMSAFDLAVRVAHGEFGVKKTSVTLPEGLSVEEMSVILESKLPEFNHDEFIYLAKDLEGYLFPDTYFFFPTATTPDVVRLLRDTFERKITPGIQADITKSGHTLKEIITMASIIQDEAYDGYSEKQMISGILWKRIEKGMRLQVDATLRYVTGKSSKELTVKDLALDSPYNTYVKDGLPPTPIGNPGLEAIKAAIDPKDSEYFFYLHDASGKIHYAKNFEEHKKNIATYLK